MYKIKAILKDGGLQPESPLPKNEEIAMIVCDGTDYIVYEQGDELPILNQGE